jgi:hypothetical protein
MDPQLDTSIHNPKTFEEEEEDINLRETRNKE